MLGAQLTREHGVTIVSSKRVLPSRTVYKSTLVALHTPQLRAHFGVRHALLAVGLHKTSETSRIAVNQSVISHKLVDDTSNKNDIPINK